MLPTSRSELFLVCGLGSLGQHCVVALQKFGVRVVAIEQGRPESWEIPQLEDYLDRLIIGDSRQSKILEDAGVACCRAVLIVTSNDRINAETALAVRSLNASARLVVRSGQVNLNQVLGQHLGNFIAFEPAQMSADAFALAALGTGTLGLFNLGSEWLRVVYRRIQPGEPACDRRQMHEFNNPRRRLLFYIPAGTPPDAVASFYDWSPDCPVRAGDVVVYVEKTDFLLVSSPARRRAQSSPHQWRQKLQALLTMPLNRKGFARQRAELWEILVKVPIRGVAMLCGIVVLGLLLIGTLLFRFSYPEATLLSSFYATAILLLGGYADLFGDLNPNERAQWWLQLFSLGLTLAGTALVGVLYALVTQALLSAKFQLTQRRPPLPKQDHVVLIGIRRVGQRVATLLLELNQALVGIPYNPEFDPTILPKMHLLTGNVREALSRANLQTAKSVVVGTDDEILNLEIGLRVYAVNPDCHLVIRTYGQRLSENLSQLLPKATIVNVYAVVAKAFAGAAFGEEIISLFRLSGETILVTEYRIEAGDTLNDLLLADIAYGYEVVPIFHEKPGKEARLMPSDDVLLVAGDRLIVLASIEGLRRVEQGALDYSKRCWQVRVIKALTETAFFEGGNVLARVGGVPLRDARALMKDLPGILSRELYEHQAKRLVRELSKVQVAAELVTQPIVRSSAREPRGPVEPDSLKLDRLPE